MPHGKEAEVTGFFVYFSQILVWLPPMIFSFLVEMNVHQKFGVIAIGAFGLVAIVFFQMAPSFDEIVREVQNNNNKLGSLGQPKADLSKLVELDGKQGTMV